MADLPLLSIVIVDVWNVAAAIMRGGAGKRPGNISSLCVILRRLLPNVHMKPITYTPLEGDKRSVYTFYDSRGGT